MACGCRGAGLWMWGDDDAPRFRAMPSVATRPDWRVLKLCGSCGQHWQVDGHDPWTPRVRGLAIKIDSPGEWRAFDDAPFRHEALIEHHGGLAAERCHWQGCSGQALLGLVFCPHHAHEQLRLRPTS